MLKEEGSLIKCVPLSHKNLFALPDHFMAKWYSVTQHRLNPLEEGVLFDLGSQILDLARNIVGQESVSLEGKIWKKQLEEDHIPIKRIFQIVSTVLCDVA